MNCQHPGVVSIPQINQSIDPMWFKSESQQDMFSVEINKQILRFIQKGKGRPVKTIREKWEAGRHTLPGFMTHNKATVSRHRAPGKETATNKRVLK